MKEDPGPVVDVRSLTHRRGRTTIVDAIDLAVHPGEVVAILGPNGAGKTSLMTLLMGYATPTSGTVQVLGTSPARARNAGRIGAMLQGSGLPEELTVGAAVRMVAACYVGADVERVITLAGLTDLLDQRVGRCSGGERQRVRFALALLGEPDLYLLDEPTVALDVAARADFWRIMRREARAGSAVLFATHYLQEAEEFADRFIVLNHGKVMTTGSLDALRAGGRRTLSCRWLAEGLPHEKVAAHFPTVVTIEGGERVHFELADTDGLAMLLLRNGWAEQIEITPGRLATVLLDEQQARTKEIA